MVSAGLQTGKTIAAAKDPRTNAGGLTIEHLDQFLLIDLENPAFEITELPNPLEKEATALRSNATRAGRFLISCLPSIPENEDQL